MDWSRSATGLPFEEVRSERFLLQVGGTKTLEPDVGVVDLSATPVDIAPAPGKQTWVQIRGAFATNPWASALAVAGQLLTATLQPDGSLLLTGAGLGALTSVRPGDRLYLSGADYGDAGAFSTANQGIWGVVSIGVGVTLRRVYAEDVTGVTETVTTVGTGDIQHLPESLRPQWAFIRGLYGYAGVKLITAAVSGWVAIADEAQFADAVGVTLDCLVVVPRYIAYVRVETDKPVTVVVGDVGVSANEISLLPVSSGAPGWYEGFAFGTSLAITNAGGYDSATINCIYAFSSSGLSTV